MCQTHYISLIKIILKSYIMTRPTFPVSGIIKKGVISLLLGGILGFLIGLVIMIFEMPVGGFVDFNTVVIITILITFLLLSYSTIATYYKEVKEFEKNRERD